MASTRTSNGVALEIDEDGDYVWNGHSIYKAGDRFWVGDFCKYAPRWLYHWEQADGSDSPGPRFQGETLSEITAEIAALESGCECLSISEVEAARVLVDWEWDPRWVKYTSFAV